MATVLTMSATRQPRLRSLTGLLSRWSIGPSTPVRVNASPAPCGLHEHQPEVRLARVHEPGRSASTTPCWKRRSSYAPSSIARASRSPAWKRSLTNAGGSTTNNWPPGPTPCASRPTASTSSRSCREPGGLAGQDLEVAGDVLVVGLRHGGEYRVGGGRRPAPHPTRQGAGAGCMVSCHRAGDPMRRGLNSI